MNPNQDPDFDRRDPEPAPTETEHARLCAYLLGELAEFERPRMERRLDADPALAAEAEKIRATLALVSTAFPDVADAPKEYALSEDRRAALLTAAKHARSAARRRYWWPGLAAAVMTIVAVGLYRGSGTMYKAADDFGVLTATGTSEDSGALRRPESDLPGQARDSGRFQPPPDPTQMESAERTGEVQVVGVDLGLTRPVEVTVSDEVSTLARSSDARSRDTLGGADPTFIGGVTIVPEAASRGLYALEPEAEKLAKATELLLVAKPDTPDKPGYMLFRTSTQEAPAASTATTTLEAGLTQRLDIAAAARIAARAGEINTMLPPIVNEDAIDKVNDYYMEVANGAAVMDIADLTLPLSPDSVIDHCRRQPNETPAMMFFRFWGDNPFIRTARDPVSTFSADVDTASYALARRYLNAGLIPEKAAVRTEEFVNYFRADVPAPEHGTFRIHLEGAKSLFGGAANDRYLLRVTLRGRDASDIDRPNHRLTFVVDTSGSMKEHNRMELVKHGLRLLVAELTERDQISIVAFNANAQLILPMTSVRHRGVIEAAIHGLTPDGSTNAEAGLKLGYEVAAISLSEEATSRVILLSDGVANVGQTDQDRINSDVKNRREQGIYLNTIGVGLGNHNDVFLEQLADRGDGICNYIDSEKEAQRALVENFTGALVTIARDVKIQVEFDPAIISSYRQLGYENRAVADHDFRNDAVDAGEVGAGHQVTALYEVEPLVDLRSAGAPLGVVRVRYKPPFGGAPDDAATEASRGDGEGEIPSAQAAVAATEIEASFGADDLSLDYSHASPGYRRATLVAEFAELLRRSSHARDGSLDLLYHEATLLDAELKDPDFTEFCELVKSSREIIATHRGTDDPLSQSIDAVRRNAILRAELEDLAHERDAALLEQIERENQLLEDKIRELLRDRTTDKR